MRVSADSGVLPAFDGSWSPVASRRFRTRHGLGLIEAAARSCGVYAGRSALDADLYAVRVVVGGAVWLVQPAGSAWIAEIAQPPGCSGTAQLIWMHLQPGEVHIPTSAWGAFLAGSLRDRPELPVPARPVGANANADQDATSRLIERTPT